MKSNGPYGEEKRAYRCSCRETAARAARKREDMNTRWYSQRLGSLSEQQFQAALDRFQLGRFISTEPVELGSFGQNIFLTSTHLFGWSYVIMPRLPGLSLASQEVKQRRTEHERRRIAGALGTTLAELHTLIWPSVGDYDLARDGIKPLEQSYAEHVLARVRGALATCIRATTRTTPADISWVEEVITQG